MTSTTTYYNLILYNSTTDQSALFATFRADLDGTAVGSNMNLIDAALHGIQTQVTTLQTTPAVVPVSATFSSGTLYTATASGIASYVNNSLIVLDLDTTVTGAVTININSLGVVSLIKKNSSGATAAIQANDLGKNRRYLFQYNTGSASYIWVNAQSGDQVSLQGTSGSVATISSAGYLDGTVTQSVLISGTTHAATSKATPVDADELGLLDSVASYGLKKLTWANLKATLKTYFDTLYANVANLTGATETLGGSNVNGVATTSSRSDHSHAITNPALDTLAATTDITTLNSTSSSHGLLPKLSGNTMDVFRGDGSYGAIYAPEGFLQNGQIVTSVSSNNITVAIKTLAGNVPSATDPVYIRIGNTIQAITSALTATKNAGTNWFNSGATGLATNQIDYFVYLIQETGGSAGTKIGFSRIPWAINMSGFSNTTTNERYVAGSWTNFNSTDKVVVVGRFNAVLSATSSFNWSIPATSIIINAPVFNTRTLTYTPTVTSGSGTPTSTTPSISYIISLFKIESNILIKSILKNTAAGDMLVTFPFSLSFTGVAGVETSTGKTVSVSASGTTQVILNLYDGTTVWNNTYTLNAECDNFY